MSKNWAQIVQSKFFSAEVPITTIVALDASASMQATGQVEELSAIVCQQIKPRVIVNDRIELFSFANNASKTHEMTFTSRLETMGVCNKQNYLDHLTSESITADVAKSEGTRLFDAVVSIKGSSSNISTNQDAGTVYIFMVHADDQSVGSDNEIPIQETAARMEELLIDSNTALVVLAIDGELRRGLQQALNHPQARVSAMSEASIEDSIHWAYEIARSPSVRPMQGTKASH